MERLGYNEGRKTIRIRGKAVGYSIVTVIILLLAAVVGWWVIKLLAGRHWLLAWIRGTFGLMLILLVVVLVLAALDVHSYRQLAAEKNIATISFRALGPQQFMADFVEFGGSEGKFELYGDQWQLDSRIIKWHSLISRLGMKTGYRLNRLSGRYLSLTDEETKPRSIYALKQSPVGVDLWHWLRRFEGQSIVDAHYGNATFLPMVDGGQYQIFVSTSGLLARPLNQPAKDAVELWK